MMFTRYLHIYQTLYNDSVRVWRGGWEGMVRWQNKACTCKAFRVCPVSGRCKAATSWKNYQDILVLRHVYLQR